MAQNLIKVSVPGSLMLLGEHAVLHGKQAIVCAIDQRLRLSLQPRADKVVMITDTRLGTYATSLDALTIEPPFTHVLRAILCFKSLLHTGFVLNIEADFAANLGFGSSAAVTVATVAAMSAWLQPCANDQIFAVAQQCNAGGSGADIAASIYGGTLHYSVQDQVLQSLGTLPPLTAVYCGYKTPTADVIKIVDAARQQQPGLYANLFAAIQDCVSAALVALRERNWSSLGEIFAKQHYLQAALGVSNNLLDSIVLALSARSEIYGAKISGAGLGDCVIGLGKLETELFNTNGQQQMTVHTSDRGLVYEHN